MERWNLSAAAAASAGGAATRPLPLLANVYGTTEGTVYQTTTALLPGGAVAAAPASPSMAPSMAPSTGSNVGRPLAAVAVAVGRPRCEGERGGGWELAGPGEVGEVLTGGAQVRHTLR